MAKKVAVNQSESTAFTELDDIIDKEFDGLIDLSKVDTKVNLWYDFGIYSLNYISSKNLFGGVPAGRITSLKGLSGCLSADTLIPINRGVRTGVRYYRIEDLFKKLNRII